MFNYNDWVVKVKNLFKQGDRTCLTDLQFYEREIQNFKTSNRYRDMITGEKYYIGEHDILKRVRTVIGENGHLKPIYNLPNNRIVDNQYKKMVDQKANYLLGKPLAVQSDNEEYAKILNEIFDKKFNRIMKNVAEDSLNNGIGWILVNYDNKGKLEFKRIKPYELIAGWADSEHTKLDYAIRVYEMIKYEGSNEKLVEKVEIFTTKGIDYFELTDGRRLQPSEPFHQDYFLADGIGHNWNKIPLIPFKYNNKEIPLIKMIKILQDGLNLIESNFQNQMEEDPRNTILILRNYDGTNLAEFRKNLAEYGVIKVKTIEGNAGGVDTLQIDVNSQNYQVILELFKKAIIENAMGYDAKDDRLSGNPNQLNIRSMYSDIDLDANGMETEYQASFEELLYFVNAYLCTAKKGNFEDIPVNIIFNRDILINETEVIENCVKSENILSKKTIIANHPWVDDPIGEIERIKEQEEEEQNPYLNTFPKEEKSVLDE